jgi:DNA-binding response OmpR family regulator
MTAKKNEIVRQHELEQGAMECLFKPFNDTDLLEAINAALQID